MTGLPRWRPPCDRCGGAMLFETGETACCPDCGHRQHLPSREAVDRRARVMAVARADAQSWLSRQPKRGRPRVVRA